VDVRRVLILAAAALAALFAGLTAYCAFRAGLYPISNLGQSAPRRTALMLQREAEARAKGRPFRVDQRWVSYDRVSPVLRRAILVAEDAAFYEHGGLDWDEIRASARVNLERRRVVRGGSTITQQLAKNLSLGDRRTFTRKLTEAFLAMRLEQVLSKRRIFELYLNLIEWGDGIFGAEAASQRYFGVPASGLSERQAVLLAAVIINPRRYSVLAPSRRIERRVRLIAGRMYRRGYLSEEAYESAIGAPARVSSPTDSGSSTQREAVSAARLPPLAELTAPGSSARDSAWRVPRP
jgi:monofunctional biosynthetic peptidoglycan transglycosylase